MGRGNPQSHTVKCEQEGKMLAPAPASGGREPCLAEQHEGRHDLILCINMQSTPQTVLSVGEGDSKFHQEKWQMIHY